jgi:hypothetical protein
MNPFTTAAMSEVQVESHSASTAPRALTACKKAAGPSERPFTTSETTGATTSNTSYAAHRHEPVRRRPMAPRPVQSGWIAFIPAPTARSYAAFGEDLLLRGASRRGPDRNGA